MAGDELSRLRQDIRAIDADVLRLVNDRLDAARRVGRVKRRHGLPLRNYEVEADVMRFARRQSRKLNLSRELSESLMRLLIRASVREQERILRGRMRR